MKCDECQKDVTRVTFVVDDPKGRCRDCHRGPSVSPSAGLITDDIPGGLVIKHGLCNEDGSPRKFYSKSEIRREAYERGWTISGETPKPNPRLRDLRESGRS